MPVHEVQRSSFFGGFLFAVMVATVATVMLRVMWEYPWLSAAFVGGGVALLAWIVLSVLLRRPKAVPPPKPVGRAPNASAGREGLVVPARGAEGEPNTTAQSRTLAGATDAGGVGRPATPAARSPLDPAEIPVVGAGGPTIAPSAAEATDARAGEAVPAGRTGAGTGDDHARSREDRASAGAASGEARERPASAPASAAPSAEAAAPPVAPEVEPLGAATPEPRRPDPLPAPRGGQADDLTRIRGIGPALERRLHEAGVFHLDQIAAWGPAEVAWADRSIEDFKGRATRDDWVGQARALSSG